MAWGRTNGKSDGEFRPPPVKARISLKDISRKAALAAERHAILEALEQTHWNRIRAAKLLGISYRALLYKIKDAARPGREVVEPEMRDDFRRAPEKDNCG